MLSDQIPAHSLLPFSSYGSDTEYPRMRMITKGSEIRLDFCLCSNKPTTHAQLHLRYLDSTEQALFGVNARERQHCIIYSVTLAQTRASNAKFTSLYPKRKKLQVSGSLLDL